MVEHLFTEIQDAFDSRTYLVTWHATRQAEERKIMPHEIEQAVTSPGAEIIEDYPNDPRGASCLVLGTTEQGRILHVQVSYPPTVWVITVYEPSEEKWLTQERGADDLQRCPFCTGTVEERMITYTTEHEGHVVVVANVPASVCRQCGERAFRPDVVEKLQRIVWGQAKPAKPMEVDSYDFAEVA